MKCKFASTIRPSQINSLSLKEKRHTHETDFPQWFSLFQREENKWVVSNIKNFVYMEYSPSFLVPRPFYIPKNDLGPRRALHYVVTDYHI